MKYRVSQLTHDCPQQKDGQASVIWERGKWHYGYKFLDAKKPKCPYCKKALYEPAKCNWIEQGEHFYYIEALKQTTTYTCLYIARVDRRRKEYK